jgi:phospho-N-acetylmuramoyl-pentapeptide-transferase
LIEQYKAALVAFIIVIIAGLFIIPMLAKLKFGQMVRNDGPKSHIRKTGTPTMGGIIFIPAIALSVLVLSELTERVIMTVIIMIGFSLIGFFDDYIKIKKKRSLGLKASQKLLFQIILAFILAIYAYYCYPSSGTLKVPWRQYGWDLGLMFIPFTVFVTLGTVNSVNLTDGLDGLVSGIMVIISFFYTLTATKAGLSDMAIISAAVTGACIGFLVYNFHPAKVFMGDTGSLGLGGVLAAISVLTRTHLYLILFGMIFIVETLSVILQVIAFRFTGKRLFKMSPIHHHFELNGWSEKKVVFVFWAFTLVTGFIGFMLVV